MESLSIKELVVASNGTLVNGNELDEIKKIVIDSRAANEGDAFIAIIGENLDGHKFIQSALENGCKTLASFSAPLAINDLSCLFSS